jgi:hypothetical protein
MKTAVAILSIAAVASTFACTSDDRDEIQAWMRSCDRFKYSNQKFDVESACGSLSCTGALNSLVTTRTRTCYERLRMGYAANLDKYASLRKDCKRKHLYLREVIHPAWGVQYDD